MSSGDINAQIARLWKIQASLNDLVLEGKRDPKEVADVLQGIVFYNFRLVHTFHVSVPSDYEQKLYLCRFIQGHLQEVQVNDSMFWSEDPGFIRGQNFEVRIYSIPGHAPLTLCARFMEQQNAKFLGAHGVVLAASRHRQLPEGLSMSLWTAAPNKDEYFRASTIDGTSGTANNRERYVLGSSRKEAQAQHLLCFVETKSEKPTA